jgi:hypothetical protein
MHTVLIAAGQMEETMYCKLNFTSLKHITALEKGKLTYSCCADSNGNNHILFGRYNKNNRRMDLMYVRPDGSHVVVSDMTEGRLGNGGITSLNNIPIIVFTNYYAKPGIDINVPFRSYKEHMDRFNKELIVLHVDLNDIIVDGKVPFTADFAIHDVFYDNVNTHILATINSEPLHHYIVKNDSLIYNRIHDGEGVCSDRSSAIDSKSCIHYVFKSEVDNCYYYTVYNGSVWSKRLINIPDNKSIYKYSVCIAGDNSAYMLYTYHNSNIYSLVLLSDEIKYLNQFTLTDDYSTHMTFIDNESLLISHGDRSENQICISSISPLQAVPKTYCQNLDSVIKKCGVPESDKAPIRAYYRTHISVTKKDGISGSVIFDNFDDALDCPCVYESRFRLA